MKGLNMISRIALATAIATAALSASPALAQDATVPQDTQAESEATAGGLEEIVVTARKREENLQDAPVAVTALSTSRIAEIRTNNLGALSSLAPNLIVTPATGAGAGGNIFIRGIGQNDPSPYLDAPTSVYVNGVLRARTSLNLSELGDIERIEVLRGPQGTLFGRNTTGGAINIFTPGPTKDFGMKVSAGIGTDREFLVRQTVNTGDIGAGLRLRASYFHRQIGGVVEDPGRSSKNWSGAINTDGFDVRLAGNWGKLSVDYEFDYIKNLSMPYNQQIVFFVNTALLNYFNQSAALGGGSIVVSPTKLEVQDSRDYPQQEADLSGHSFTLNYDLSDALQIKSITAWRNGTETRPHNSSSQAFLLGRVAQAGAPGGFIITEVTPLQTTQRDMRQRQFSEEFQLLGDLGALSYVAGLYYMIERFDETNVNFNTSVNGAGLGVNRYTKRQYHYETDSWAAFGQATWRPGDGKLDITAGIRYTEDRKEIDDYAFTNDVQTRHFVGEDTFRNVSGVASIGYKWTPDILTYARVGTGYKAGGFVPGSAIDSFKPEKVTSYEVGIKSEFWGRVRLNVAGFYSRYADLQISGRIADPITGVRISTLTNAGRANYTGAEAELSAQLGGGFSFDGNIGYVKPVYEQFPFFTGTADINVADEARFPYVSNLTFDAGLRYTANDTAIGNFTARVNYQYQSSRYFFALTRLNVNNDRLKAPGQGFLNARATLTNIPIGGSNSLKAELYVDNILDTDRILGSIDSTNYGSTFFGRGRQGGMQVTVGF